MTLRNRTTVAVLGLLALFAAAPALAGGDSDSDSDSDRRHCRGDNLKILEVFVGSGLTIVGQGFDVGRGPLEVSLAGIPLTVTSADGTTILAGLPDGLRIPGQYLLEVSNGKCRGKRQYDEFDLAIEELPCPCLAIPEWAALVSGAPINSCIVGGPEPPFDGYVVLFGVDDITWSTTIDAEAEALTCGVSGGPILPVTPEQHVACATLMLAAAAAQEVPCD